MNTLVTLNIGLNNNPFTAQEIADNFNEFYASRGAVIETFVGLGEYVKNPEPTLVVKISTDLQSWIWWKSEVSELTIIYTQECIPIRVESTDSSGIKTRNQELIFNPDYTGERYEFDEKFFITEPTQK